MWLVLQRLCGWCCSACVAGAAALVRLVLQVGAVQRLVSVVREAGIIAKTIVQVLRVAHVHLLNAEFAEKITFLSTKYLTFIFITKC